MASDFSAATEQEGDRAREGEEPANALLASPFGEAGKDNVVCWLCRWRADAPAAETASRRFGCAALAEQTLRLRSKQADASAAQL